MFKKLAMTAALAATFGLGAGSASAGLIGFDPNGAAPGGPGILAVSAFDWAPGATLFDNAAFDGANPELGVPIWIRVQGYLNVFEGPGLNPFTAGLGEFTFQMQVPVLAERVNGDILLTITDDPAVDANFFDPARNFFKIYHDPVADVGNQTKNNAQLLNGCGFGFDDAAPCPAGPDLNDPLNPNDDERLIFQAVFDPGGSTVIAQNTVRLLAGGTNLQALDQFGINNFPTVRNQQGTSSSIQTGLDFELDPQDPNLLPALFPLLGITFIDPNYFVTAVDSISIIDTIQQGGIGGTPFNQTNPNAQIVGATPVYGADVIPGPGVQFINNLECEGLGRNCDVQMQHDMSLVFNNFSYVPEPGSVALLGFGLSALAFGFRRPRRNA